VGYGDGGVAGVAEDLDVHLFVAGYVGTAYVAVADVGFVGGVDGEDMAHVLIDWYGLSGQGRKFGDCVYIHIPLRFQLKPFQESMIDQIIHEWAEAKQKIKTIYVAGFDT